MTTLALLASGFLAGILFVVLCAIIGIGRRSKAANDRSDQHSDWSGE